jgi:hypothetical protein
MRSYPNTICQGKKNAGPRMEEFTTDNTEEKKRFLKVHLRERGFGNPCKHPKKKPPGSRTSLF